MRPRVRRSRAILQAFMPRHPAQVVIVAFLVAITVITALLSLPIAAEPGKSTTFLQALFTATSAVCVTGLLLVDTPTHWSVFGEVTIMVGFQLGGFGIMTSASLLGLLVSRRLGLRSRLLTAAETKSLDIGDVRKVVKGVAIAMAIIETIVAILLGLRFWLAYDLGLGRAAYLGVFHSVSAVSNAGFVLYSDNITGFVTDPFVCVPLMVGVILGGIGFPVLFEVRRRPLKPRSWSMHTKVTLFGTAVLIFGGAFVITVFEWTNARTLGPLNIPGKLLAGTFQGIMPRTAGFNSVDTSAMHETSWLVTDALMFIGGGSAGTAGGIKVATFMLLFFAIMAEARGEPSIDVFGRRLPQAALRQAISVALLGVAAIAIGTLFLLAVSGLDLDRVLFEAIAAFSTAGLSTGITSTLPPAGHYALIVLMFVGRTGTITLASALALRSRHRLYRLPEERPIIG